MSNVPKLRFKEFSGEWEEKKLKDITDKIGSGSTPKGGEKVYKTSGIPFIRSQNVNNNKLIFDEVTFIDNETHFSMKNSSVKANDILLNITGASIGRSCVVPTNFREGNVNQHVCIVRVKENFNPIYLQTFLSSNNGQKLIFQGQTGSGREGINFQSIGLFKIHLPKLEEQEKIASFLTSVDTKIEQLTKKESLLQEYKKGVMQKIFNQEIRFKDEKRNDFSDWKTKKLGEFLKQKSNKNKNKLIDLVLSVSNKKGFITQNEQFDGYEVASKDITGYKIVEKGDYAYNPSRINVGSIARLKDYDRGIVSPMYVIFSLTKQMNPLFFDNLYKTHKFKHLIKISCSGSVRDSLNFNDLASFKVSLPCLKEQEKIANLFSSIDKKIEVTKIELEKTKEFKKALLQQMFV